MVEIFHVFVTPEVCRRTLNPRPALNPKSRGVNTKILKPKVPVYCLGGGCDSSRSSAPFSG